MNSDSKVKDKMSFRYNLNSSNSNSFYKGFFFAFIFLSILGVLTAVGFHTADEIMSGSFVGNFDFSGATVTGLDSGGVLVDSTLICNSTNEGLIKYNTTSNKFYACNEVEWKQIDLGASETDPTLLLLHLDSVGFEDSSSFSHSTTGTGVTVSGTSKFGSSAQFSSHGDQIQIADSANLFLEGDFTIDFWVRFTTDAPDYQVIFAHGDAGPGPDGFIRLYRHKISGGWDFHFYNSSGGDYITYLDAPSINTWYHIAIVRTGTTIKFFRDGSQLGTDWADPTNGDTITFGPAGFILANNWGPHNDNLFGYLDEFRISKEAVWTSSFTPPSSPY